MTCHEGNRPESGSESMAAVGVLVCDSRFLVIERSQYVIAPGKICFPGGSIEPGESPESALQRELAEELNLDVVPEYEVYQSITPWNCKVHWWKIRCNNLKDIKPDPREVAAWFWMDAQQLVDHPGLLTSNRQFLEALLSGKISLEGGS